MEHPLKRTFDLGQWLRDTTGEEHLIGRVDARNCREAIEAQLHATADGAVTTLDCRGLDHLDFTAADECFAKLTLRAQALEFGEVYLILLGVTPIQRENIEAALHVKKLAMLLQGKDGPDVIGFCHPFHRETFSLIKYCHVTGAHELAEAYDGDTDRISLASTKLLNLFKARLVQRTPERLPDGGRQYIYRVVESHLKGELT